MLEKVEEKAVRYSDAELEEFKALILYKIKKERENLSYLQGLCINEHGTDDTSPTYKDCMEGGNESTAKEENSKSIAKSRQFIQHLEAALVRIENKTYGICRETGTLIPKIRLLAVPHATLCIEAKENK